MLPTALRINNKLKKIEVLACPRIILALCCSHPGLFAVCSGDTPSLSYCRALVLEALSYGLNCVPTNPYIEVISTIISECGLIWK